MDEDITRKREKRGSAIATQLRRYTSRELVHLVIAVKTDKAFRQRHTEERAQEYLTTALKEIRRRQRGHAEAFD